MDPHRSSNDATNADIVCKNEYRDSSTNVGCLNAKFSLANTKSVDIICNGYYSCSTSTFNVNKAGSVSIVVTGTYALNQCTVQGLEAGYLDLGCSSMCYKNNLYVPNNFKLSCYGNSYVKSMQNVGVYFNGCGVCDIADDCSPQQMTIHCDKNVFGTWSNSDIWGTGSCLTNHCGCNHINNVTKKAFFVDEDECPNYWVVPAVHAVATLVTGVIIAIVAGGICYCICVAVCIYYACCRPRKPRGPALIVAGAPYVAVTQAGAQPTVVMMNPNQVPTQKYVPPPQPNTAAIATTAPVVTDASVNAYPRL